MAPSKMPSRLEVDPQTWLLIALFHPTSETKHMCLPLWRARPSVYTDTCDNLFALHSGFRHLKDVILLTAIVQVLSTISSYFWYLWLLVRAFLEVVQLI